MVLRVSLYVVLGLAVVGFEVVHSQSAGDACVLNKGGNGVCKKIIECPSAIDALKQNQLPQTCGFIGTTPVVCCEGGMGSRTGSVPGEISREKCEEYSKFAYTYFTPPVLSFGAPRNASRLQCPFKVIPLIIGGTKAKAKEFPHSAAIGYDSTDGTSRVYHCGGSLISDEFVLSAGHCKNSRSNGLAKYVRLGDLNLISTSDDAKPQEYNIKEFIDHPEYRPPSTYNDILLIKLEEKVKFNHYVRPICLYTEFQPPTKSAIASGWGKTEDADGSDDLLKVTLEFFSQNECFKYFPANRRKYSEGIIEKSQICAGSRSELKDTCQGDSGGPLQIFSDVPCSYSLVGITSFGKFCGIVKVPAVYTRVYHYVEWIEKNVWP